MLIRPDDDGSVLLITQNAHAWVSGQLARAWNSEDGGIEPHEEVMLAAEQHDIGWMIWEASPSLNKETGLPHGFRELPRRSHLQIWGRARRYSMVFGRYPALLISMHGTGLFERFGPGEDAPASERALVENFLSRERVAQQRLIENLAEDPRYEELVQAEILEANSNLIRIWDGLSLAICGGIDDAGATVGEYSLSPGSFAREIAIDPWPFSSDELTVFAEARRLTDRYERQPAMRTALASAEQLALEFHLVPGE
jgi:hypothetical protein